jgi:hypothetical protein
VEKPKVVWITKRIPWIRGRPLYVAQYFCNAPSCSVATEGRVKGSAAAGVRSQPLTSSAKAGAKGKKKQVLVGRGKTTIAGGGSGKIYLRLNKTGAAVLEKRGKATINLSLTTPIPGQAGKVSESHVIHVYLKKKKKKPHH